MMAADLVNRFAVLREVLSDDRYTDVDIARLIELCCELDIEAGDVLIAESMQCDERFVVVEGRLEITEQTGRRWVSIAGTMLDPTNGNDEGRSVVLAVALGPTTVLAIRRSALA